jgi:hypothetical protein
LNHYFNHISHYSTVNNPSDNFRRFINLRSMMNNFSSNFLRFEIGMAILKKVIFWKESELLNNEISSCINSESVAISNRVAEGKTLGMVMGKIKRIDRFWLFSILTFLLFIQLRILISNIYFKLFYKLMKKTNLCSYK